MCGKYHITTEDENLSFQEAIRQLMLEHPEIRLQQGDILPSQIAPVQTAGGLAPMRFGHKATFTKSLLINARSETAAQSRLFAPRLRKARCLVPAHSFYEWDEQKKPHLFQAAQGGLLHMAGLYFEGEGLPQFVILTREAKGPPALVHPRMPVIFLSQELQSAWLHQEGLFEELLLMPPIEDALEAVGAA